MKCKESNFLKNVFYALGAQVISLTASILVSFIVPKLIDVSNYAFWQLFLFYVTYINISRLGYIDGLYLRLGGKKYDELDHNKLGNQWIIYVLFQFIIAIILSILVISGNMSADRKFVFLMCCLCVVLINSNNFFSYILQAVNLTKYYSVSVMIQNFAWFLAVLIIFVFKIYSYKVIVICYVLGHLISGIYLMCYTKEIVFFKPKRYKGNFKDIFESIKCGICLMISTYAGNLIIGSSRMIIDNAWGVEVFAYFSFSLTLANFVLNFINQISMVMFPALKRLAQSTQAETYELLRNALGIILPIILLGYLPITFLVNLWLPQYQESLKYLAFFLPICTFEGKMQMLCSTYFKVLRKEKFLMIINIITMLVSAFLSLIGCYFINNIYFVALAILFVIALRSIISEIYLAKLMKKQIYKQLIVEIILVIIFLISTLIFSEYISSLLYLFVYVIYVLINKKILKQLLVKFNNKRRKK